MIRPAFAVILFSGLSLVSSRGTTPVKEVEKPKVESGDAATPAAPAPAKDVTPAAAPKEEKPEAKAPEPPEPTEKTVPAPVDPDDAVAAEKAEAEQAAVAKPVNPDPVQVYGWREYILVNGVEDKFTAKLDTGAFTSSIHAEEKELFERDGKKWVRFIVTDPTVEKPARTRIEAPLVRIARIKEPGSESVAREVVRLGFQIGDRKMRGEFTLNNRGNMLAPVLIGRTLIKDLGMVDAGRTHLAEQKIFR
jgi:hypothetical protein